ncbi:MAG: 2-oxoacid:ferredoxin oxidoreductase subunit beta [Myxococcales bacterium]|nr:2-oxoacid:ferredoxin oxidoreductase subunit beta [Myxococcales bacterium]
MPTQSAYPVVEHTDPAGQTKQDFTSDQDVRWCPGCGDYSILAQVQKLMPTLGIPKENFVFVSGIGCSSRFPYYMNTYGIHSIHGRAPAVATGIKAVRPDLSVWLVTGDGDGLSIGGNHLLHVLRRNVDVKILLFNNQIYGLTKGQYSPTSPLGKKAKSTPLGSVDYPLDPVSVALGAGATFVARTVDTNVKHIEATLKRAAAHKGSAFVEIYQNCPIFNDAAFDFLTDKSQKEDNELVLEHGKPLRFGPNGGRGIALDGSLTPRIVDVTTEGEDKLLRHDETNEMVSLVVSRLKHPAFPVPVGVFRAVDRPSYDVMMNEQVEAASQGNKKSLQQLIDAGSWTVA